MSPQKSCAKRIPMTDFLPFFHLRLFFYLLQHVHLSISGRFISGWRRRLTCPPKQKPPPSFHPFHQPKLTFSLIFSVAKQESCLHWAPKKLITPWCIKISSCHFVFISNFGSAHPFLITGGGDRQRWRLDKITSSYSIDLVAVFSFTCQ